MLSDISQAQKDKLHISHLESKTFHLIVEVTVEVSRDGRIRVGRMEKGWSMGDKLQLHECEKFWHELYPLDHHIVTYHCTHFVQSNLCK